MRQPPRDPDAALLSAPMLRAIVGYGALIAGAALGAYVWGLGQAEPAGARTMAFMTLALAQIFHLGNARARGRWWRRQRRSGTGGRSVRWRCRWGFRWPRLRWSRLPACSVWCRCRRGSGRLPLGWAWYRPW